IEAAAKRGDGTRFALPRPLAGKPGADFSLSGLKTALRLAAEAVAPLSEEDVDDLAASFQAAVVDIVRDRAAHAIAMFAEGAGLFARPRANERGSRGPVLVIAGGGAWGTALALTAARAGRRTTLWARNIATVNSIRQRHDNPKYLPGIVLDAPVAATAHIGEAVDADLLILAVPAQAVRAVLGVI